MPKPDRETGLNPDERDLVDDELPFDPWEAEEEDGTDRRRDPLRGPVPRREPVGDEVE